MEDFNSKYTGRQVEDLLDQVASGNAGGGGGGGITVETDPIFSTSPAASITEEQIRTWDDTYEFVEDINGDISKLYNALDDKQDILVSGENIKTINGESIVGSGDMVVGKITYFSEEDSLELSPGVVCIRTRMVVNSVQITSFASNNKPFAEYAYYFSTGTIADGNAVKLILPDGVKYANKDVFDALESDTHYELSVVRSAGIVKAVLTAFK
jgi:hypothetical protein